MTIQTDEMRSGFKDAHNSAKIDEFEIKFSKLTLALNGVLQTVESLRQEVKTLNDRMRALYECQRRIEDYVINTKANNLLIEQLARFLPLALAAILLAYFAGRYLS